MKRERQLRLAVAAVLFVNAFLVFVLQPHISKRLLPVLGGSAEVWIVCSLFFQLALVGGYAFAYASRRMPLRASLGVHALVLAIASLLWRFSAGDGPPPGATPPLWTLQLLIGQLGPVLIALTATSPLLQYAYARAAPTRDPYVLFTASNAGSLAGLFAYPFVVEPLLTLEQQARAWRGSAIALVVMLTVVAIALIRASSAAPPIPIAQSAAPSALQRMRWVMLSLVPSVLLLSVTAQITTDIAPVPLLWIVPLAVYLASFIRVFAKGWQPWRWTWPVQALFSLLMLMNFANEPSRFWWVGVHLIILWFGSLLCHGALVQERPSPSRLPEFYLLMATGGALGGCLAGVAAPLVFNMRIEYPLAVLAVMWLAPRKLGFASEVRLTWRVGFGLAVIVALSVAYLVWTSQALPAVARGLSLIFAMVAATMWHRPRVFAVLTTAALAAIAIDHQLHADGVLLRGRTFYGTYSVRDLRESQARALIHGTTLHGVQSLRPGHGADPLSYYGSNSPVADVFLTRIGDGAHVAAIGLGAGVILRYAQRRSSWTVYEVDPAIARVAQDRTLFSHWAEAAVVPRLVLGDARLQLRKAPDAVYDLIVVDAFSSDAVPMHLLTREAMALYVRKLRSGGAILFNISNRYLDLAPPIAATAARLGLVTYEASDETRDDTIGLAASQWVIVGTPAALPPPTPRWTIIEVDPASAGWTDDHSNVFAALRPVTAVRTLLSALIHY